MLLEEIKDNKRFYEKLEDALKEFIRRYKGYFDSASNIRPDILKNMARDLERLSNLMDNFGYTYTPVDVQDVPESIFEVMVTRYLEGFEKYIDGESNLETLNVDIKSLLTAVDKHKL